MGALWQIEVFAGIMCDNEIQEGDVARSPGGSKVAKVRVELKVSFAPGVEHDDGIFVAGNIPALGNWKPDAIPLVPRKRGTFGVSCEVPAGKPIEFKITRGSWRTQAIYLDPNADFPPDNRSLCPECDAQIELTIVDWLDRIVLTVDPVIGDLRTHEPMAAEGLREERSFQVWLPPSYEKCGKAYPVLYMLDGQNLFDPGDSFCGQDWKVDEVVSRLIRKKRIKEIIVVGIPNSADRMAEYNLDRPRGKAHARFLIEQVKALVDKTYRTLPDPPNTGIMGSSMGGLYAFQLAWAFPDVFGLAGCMSSAFYKSWAGVIRMLKEHPESGRHLRIYFDAGELEPPIARSFQRVKKLLLEIGLHPEAEFHAHLAPGAIHSERAWSDRLHRPLEFFFGTSGIATDPKKGILPR